MTRQSVVRCLLLLLLLPVLSARSAFAQLDGAKRDRLIGKIESTSNELVSSRLPDFDLAADRVAERIENLKPFLDRVTDSQNRDAWLRYFDLQDLAQAVESRAPSSELMAEAMSARDRLIGTTPGLEMSAVRALRDAVDHVIDTLVFRNPDRAVSVLKAQLRSLDQLVREVDDIPTPDQFNAISARVALLASSDQADDLVREFRNTFSRSNAAIMVGTSLVQQAINRPVSRQRPVRDCILGTRLVGDAQMDGHVTAALLPSIGSAKIHLSFIGHVVSHNTGFNGPVRLRTVGSSEVMATRTMTVDAAGIALSETGVQATLQTRICRIDHPLRIVRAIARKQAAKQKPAADRIAVEKLRTQVGRQFATETGQVSPLTPSQLVDRAEPMLQRLSLTRPSQAWSSTVDAICVESVFRGPEQLASITSRPGVPTPFALAIQIHESAVENAFSVMLAGRTLNERRLSELLDRIGPAAPDDGSVTPASSDQESEAPFEIGFSRSRPVIFESRGGVVRIGLRGTRFVQGDGDPLNKAMEITAIYEPTQAENGTLILRRSEEVDVDFPRERLTLREVGLKSIIQKKFSALFPNEILDQSLRIADDAKMEALRGRELSPSLARAEDGWFTLAFQ